MGHLLRLGLLLAVLPGLALAGAPAEPKPATPGDQKAPATPPQRLEHLDVWAETIEYKGATQRFHFEQKVTVIKGSMRIDCDTMDGIVDPKTRQITSVNAYGDVHLVSVASVTMGPDGLPVTTDSSDAWRSTCGEADYDLKADRIVLKSVPGKDRPRLWRAKGYGEADTIIFYPNKGEYELIGNPVIRGEIPTGPAAGTPAGAAPLPGGK